MAALPLDLANLDLERLGRLRDRFLTAGSGPGGLADYWIDDQELALYDAVFAARIGWKWDAVLDEWIARGGATLVGPIVDWGCGTGIAARRFAARLGGRDFVLHDRSERAMRFAERQLASARPGVTVRRLTHSPELAPELLLISHVLDELEARGLADLLALVERSQQVIWVEPGARAVSRQLAELRDRLVADAGFRVTAPCIHDAPCSALRAAGEHWCHFFARAPTEVFTDSGWVRLGRQLGIDLRALPYAFVALTRDAVEPSSESGARLIGRPTVGSKLARVWACDAAGLERREVVRSREPELHRALKKAPFGTRHLESGF